MTFSLQTLIATLALASIAVAAPAPASVETSAQIWTSGACDSQPVYSGQYLSGVCHNFPGGAGKYGAKFSDASGCKYKVWANQNCNGLAMSHTQNGGNCIGIADNGSQTYYLPGGGASISITC